MKVFAVYVQFLGIGENGEIRHATIRMSANCLTKEIQEKATV